MQFGTTAGQRTTHKSWYFYNLAVNIWKTKLYKTQPNYAVSTWAGPQAIPTMCLVSSPGSAVGSGLVTRKVSKCWH